MKEGSMLLERANLCKAKTGMTGWVKEFEGDCMGQKGLRRLQNKKVIRGVLDYLFVRCTSCSIAVVSRSTVAYVLHSSLQMYCSSSIMGTR